MGLCGDFRCGCGITTDGSILISGSGEPGDPYVLSSPGDTEWIDYTPTLAQGATTNIAKTVNYARYARSGPSGKTINVAVRLTVTGVGTAASQIFVTLPVACANTGGVTGGAMIYDASVGIYGMAVYGWTATQVTFVATGFWGASPSVALAVGDQLGFSFAYEAAV